MQRAVQATDTTCVTPNSVGALAHFVSITMASVELGPAERYLLEDGQREVGHLVEQAARERR
jgi:hypothetical protein